MAQSIFSYYQATVEGTRPLLMAAFPIEEMLANEGAAGRRTKPSSMTPREQAEKLAYRNPDKSLYIPTAAFARAIREAGGNHKMKGTRKSAKYVVPAAVLMMGEQALLHDADNNPLTTFEVFSISAVNQVTKARIITHRPRIDRWRATFQVRVNTNMLTPSFVNDLLTEAGMTLGVGAWRPEKGGSFGLFQVIHWDQRDAELPVAAE